MITQERKSKYKHKITIPRQRNDWTAPKVDVGMRDWCEEVFGPGGRRNRWRFGWTDATATFYFRNSRDAMMFTLRWSGNETN